MTCSDCNKKEYARKFAWRKYFEMKRIAVELAFEQAKSKEISEGTKKILKSLFSKCNDEDKNCSICLDVITTNIVITNCCHFFHQDCLSRNEDSGRNTCPICRSNYEKILL